MQRTIGLFDPLENEMLRFYLAHTRRMSLIVRAKRGVPVWFAPD
jgi:hypothetical protein